MKNIISIILAVLLIISVGLNIYFFSNISRLNQSVVELSNEVAEAKLGLSSYAEQIEAATAKLEEAQTEVLAVKADIQQKEQEIEQFTIVTDTTLSRDEKIVKLEAFDVNVEGYIAMLEEAQAPTVQEVQVPKPQTSTPQAEAPATTTANGNSGLGSMWDGIELPGDPNVDTSIGTDHSDYPWS